ncbi:MAG: hypothetical protein C5S52_08790 [ANME-2 cluster archaeon]|nr:hypothetical protein [ANME-2 cluster archaeon]
MMLLIFCRDGYGAIRPHPRLPRARIESRRMKRLQHARLPTPEESKKSIRDCKDLVGRRPIDYPAMLADATGSVQHIDATYTVGGVSM